MYFLNTFSRSELFSNSEKNIFLSSFQKSHRHIKSNKKKTAKKHLFKGQLSRACHLDYKNIEL